MAIEARRNGNLYYYKKRREGGRVVSEYVGGGILVDLDAGLPREQSEAATIVEQSYAQHPRLNYTYKNLPEIKPEGWEWQL